MSGRWSGPSRVSVPAVGTWGTGIFDSDLAAEIRESWRDAILDGLDPTAATERIRSVFSGSFDDDDEGVVAWLALALAQHETGRLQDDVRDRALEVIAKGADLEQWREEHAIGVKRREEVLERLRTKLIGPQPKEKRLRRTKPVVGAWFDRGDVVLVRGHGAQALFFVAREGHEPVVVLLLWGGGPTPTRSELDDLPGALWEARARWQAEERVGAIFRAVYEIWTVMKEDVFSGELGEVVARGVHRPDLETTFRPTSCPSWAALADALVEDGWLRRLLADAPRLHALVESGAATAHESPMELMSPFEDG